MQHPDLSQQLAGERQARYRAEAARSRLTRLDRKGARVASIAQPEPGQLPIRVRLPGLRGGEPEFRAG